MKREVLIEGRKHVVEMDCRDRIVSFWVDGQAVKADAIEVSRGIYSILLDGKSFEARVGPSDGGRLEIELGTRHVVAEVVDPRRRRRRSGELEIYGHQQIRAPMPGKVVRMLAEQGQVVEAGQGILVLEAMKMQNEVRSPKAGRLERLVVEEGQTVNSGDPLAYIA